MSTRLNISFPESIDVEQIDDFIKSRGFANRSEYIRMLIREDMKRNNFKP